MSENEPNGLRHRLSRRAALKVIAGSAGAASFPILNNAQHAPSKPVARLGSALGATRAATETYSPKFFNAQQLRTIDVLCEAIIPADEHSPGARAARVDVYIDTIIRDSDEPRRNFWTRGLAAIDRMAAIECGRNFRECAPEQQAAILQKLSANEEHPKTLAEQFFAAIKRATIDGYYTSEIGIHQELEYQGNTPLEEFEGCKHEEHVLHHG